MNEHELASGWTSAPLQEVATINPPNPARAPADVTSVSFVPMAAVEELTGRMNASRARPWSDVKRGFTRFQDGDVVFAKITPSMENGKVALASNLVNGLAAGTTEFHVLRPQAGVEGRYLLHYLLQETFRRRARTRMTGTAGQLRVPTQFLEEEALPLAPTPEQQRIVEAIDSYVTRLDDALASLERVQAKLRAYRASVLKAAVQGRLVPTEASLARAEKRDYEPATVLLARILKERRCRWEEAELAKLKAAGKTPTDDKWKAKYEEPVAPNTSTLPEIPEGWCWATVEQVCSSIVDCPHSTPKWTASGRVCVRTTEFSPGRLDLKNPRYVSESTYRERTARLRPEGGDVLYSREGGILGLACQVPDGAELCLGQRMMLMRAGRGLGRYLMHVLNSPNTLDLVRRLTGGSASPHLNVGEVRKFPVPLPPLPEVQRVVEQTEKICSVADAVDADAHAGANRCQRLRQAVLRWAFAGRLVDQDPHDEPAERLLARIRAERAAVSSTKKTSGRRARGVA